MYNDMKTLNVRNKAEVFVDDAQRVFPSDGALRALLSVGRGLLRLVYFLFSSLFLIIMFCVFVRPAKLAALTRLHWKDLRDVIFDKTGYEVFYD